ncbi:hypothetical protein FVB9288_02442 [Flavobacterium sp. CECT 9288]|uniref:hypothetical protein n=1 Tax=Flavobacterium sp. CECT 9288 TaxID=2845819 RepID=UPI001E5527CE|nr:hypothetical protein [Flavobacterium sp. CECT 9288]CAH0336729.1 hypothetical protein FVB9288_02442 [Flavobacterium sp. CECT 9288]
MKVKKIILLITINISFSLYAQFTTKEETKIEILKSKLVDNVSVFGIRQLKVTSDDLRKVMIKTKIESKLDNKTKLSAFSLLDTKNKIRYRLADYKGYAGIIGYPELIPFRKDKIYKENGEEINGYLLPPYDPSEKDYFNLFDIEGYKNFEMKINFGTTEKPKLSTLYFGETTYKKFTAELFFAILVVNKDSDYELYYKDEKVSDIQFE